jgi:hypothetical protein
MTSDDVQPGPLPPLVPGVQPLRARFKTAPRTAPVAAPIAVGSKTPQSALDPAAERWWI